VDIWVDLLVDQCPPGRPSFPITRLDAICSQVKLEHPERDVSAGGLLHACTCIPCFFL
jgi:hypothetical protein